MEGSQCLVETGVSLSTLQATVSGWSVMCLISVSSASSMRTSEVVLGDSTQYEDASLLRDGSKIFMRQRAGTYVHFPTHFSR